MNEPRHALDCGKSCGLEECDCGVEEQDKETELDDGQLPVANPERD